MRKGVRTGWLVAGGLLSVSAVLGIALAIWAGIRLPRAYDFSFPGSYDSSVLEKRSSVTTVYSLRAPMIIVDVAGRVGVRVVPGTPGRLEVRREVSGADGSYGLEEAWQDGRTLRIALDCPDDGPEGGDCLADYTLSVPRGVEVLMATVTRAVPCRLTASETVCRPAPSNGKEPEAPPRPAPSPPGPSG
ncbi:hypothetical protein [Streptosporangium carneum]|uniref:Uncharacterized protein n=1 Tax=Streptosporangium carneum TaxID=47481 RepID=A0A9W6MIP1_9ACTN|nr:hypothetical protein [Streptosporangium carneum]GLK15415.1 hypothetical protein GCM10017600_88280 [Streptosporangium carneum]